MGHTCISLNEMRKNAHTKRIGYQSTVPTHAFPPPYSRAAAINLKGNIHTCEMAFVGV